MHYEAKDFFNIASRFVGARPATAQTWWNGFFEVIVRELYTSGMVYLPKIGYFTLQHMDEKIQKQKDPDGNGVKYYVVPERDKPVFTPDDDFINDINMTGVTKSYRKRLTHEGLTLRDKERERRAKEILGLDIEEIDLVGAKNKDKLVSKFEDTLAQIKQKCEEDNQERLKNNPIKKENMYEDILNDE